MQSTEQVDNIVKTKLQSIRNKKTIKEMLTAIDEMQQEKQMDLRYAIIGLIILIPLIAYLVITLIF